MDENVHRVRSILATNFKSLLRDCICINFFLLYIDIDQSIFDAVSFGIKRGKRKRD